VVAHICNPRPQEARQEDHEFQTNPYYLLRPCLRKPKLTQSRKTRSQRETERERKRERERESRGKYSNAQNTTPNKLPTWRPPDKLEADQACFLLLQLPPF
jgi:hypothetical protein